METTTRGEGVRMAWRDAPPAFATAVETALGSAIVGASDRRGGFSPGPTAVLTLADGRQVFIKACGDELNETAVYMHRREAMIVCALPREVPAPELLLTVDDDRWFGLVYEAIGGRTPSLPWSPADLDSVFRAIDELARIEPPPSPVLRSAPEVLGRLFGFWTDAAASVPPDGLDEWSKRYLEVLTEVERIAPEATAGTSLIHGDVRADNMLLHDGRVTFVDWTHASIGAGFVERLLSAVPIELQGGPDVEEQIAGLNADADAITAIVVGFTGYLTLQALEPPPNGLPTIRQFQAQQAVVARRWCAQRLGLPLPL